MARPPRTPNSTTCGRRWHGGWRATRTWPAVGRGVARVLAGPRPPARGARGAGAGACLGQGGPAGARQGAGRAAWLAFSKGISTAAAPLASRPSPSRGPPAIVPATAEALLVLGFGDGRGRRRRWCRTIPTGSPGPMRCSRRNSPSSGIWATGGLLRRRSSAMVSVPWRWTGATLGAAEHLAGALRAHRGARHRLERQLDAGPELGRSRVAPRGRRGGGGRLRAGAWTFPRPRGRWSSVRLSRTRRGWPSEGRRTGGPAARRGGGPARATLPPGARAAACTSSAEAAVARPRSRRGCVRGRLGGRDAR